MPLRLMCYHCGSIDYPWRKYAHTCWLPEVMAKNCPWVGDCTCNCCDKRQNRHCGEHNSRCHVACTPRY